MLDLWYIWTIFGTCNNRTMEVYGRPLCHVVAYVSIIAFSFLFFFPLFNSKGLTQDSITWSVFVWTFTLHRVKWNGKCYRIHKSVKEKSTVQIHRHERENDSSDSHMKEKRRTIHIHSTVNLNRSFLFCVPFHGTLAQHYESKPFISFS